MEETYQESRKPSERTHLFLENYIATHAEGRGGERLPPARRIASELGVSEGTVRGVLRHWLKEGRLRSRQGSGVFICRTPIPVSAATVRLGINRKSPKPGEITEGPWSDRIHLDIMEAVMELGPNTVFSSLYSAAEDVGQLDSETVTARCREMDAVILCPPDPHVEALAAYCRDHRKPLVYVNSPGDDAMTNYVALSNADAFYQVTRTLRNCGRRRFALLIYPGPEHSPSTRQRLAGVINGIAEAIGRSVDLRIVICENVHDEAAYHGIRRLMNEEGFIPDAVLCAGDGLALGAYRALKDCGLSIPEQVALIAGAGFDPALLGLEITSLVQSTKEVARQVVAMALELIRRRELEIPVRVIPVGLRLGRTTTEAESQALCAVLQRARS